MHLLYMDYGQHAVRLTYDFPTLWHPTVICAQLSADRLSDHPFGG
jgi:hypothetical protein